MVLVYIYRSPCLKFPNYFFCTQVILKCQRLYTLGSYSYFLKSDMVNFKTTRLKGKKNESSSNEKQSQKFYIFKNIFCAQFNHLLISIVARYFQVHSKDPEWPFSQYMGNLKIIWCLKPFEVTKYYMKLNEPIYFCSNY